MEAVNEAISGPSTWPEPRVRVVKPEMGKTKTRLTALPVTNAPSLSGRVLLLYDRCRGESS